jgi:hypothetical protein
VRKIMSIKKICSLLACCKPSSNNRVTPAAIPEEEKTVVRVEVAPKRPGHRYNQTVEDVRELLSSPPPSSIMRR